MTEILTAKKQRRAVARAAPGSEQLWSRLGIDSSAAASSCIAVGPPALRCSHLPLLATVARPFAPARRENGRYTTALTRSYDATPRSMPSKFWHAIETNGNLILLHITDDEAPSIKYSVVVKQDLTITLHVAKTAVR